nr:D-mannonate oxidoreductase [Klebsiella pneumoniae]
MADNAGPLTLLNCDNVRHNGERFHDGMVEFLQLTGKQAVIDWMAANTTCPNTMVDRITRVRRPICRPASKRKPELMTKRR